MYVFTYSTCMSLHIIHVCLSNSISADQKWCTTSTKWNKEIYHRKSTENLPSLNTLIINITTPCTSIVNKSYTEMKEFTDEKKRKPPIQRWKSSLMKKRGNPLYRDERVHLLYCVWIQGNLLYCVWIRGNPLHCVWITSVCSHLCQA
jgi:hypothetical protein